MEVEAEMRKELAERPLEGDAIGNPGADGD